MSDTIEALPFLNLIGAGRAVERAASVLGQGGNNEKYVGDGVIRGMAPGIVTVDGLPAIRTIRLYDRGPAEDLLAIGTGLLVREVVSGSDGTYEFSGISRERKYSVMAVDDEGVHNAVVADLIVPVEMPE